MTYTKQKALNAIKKHIKLEGLLDSNIDINLISNQELVKKSLIKAITNDFLANVQINTVSLKSATIEEFNNIRIMLYQNENPDFWSYVLNEHPTRFIPALIEYHENGNTRTKQGLRNILKCCPVIFEYSTPEQMNKFTDLLTAKELVSVFKMSSQEKTVVTRMMYGWYKQTSTYYRKPGFHNVKISKELYDWFEQEIFLNSLSGVSSISTPLQQNLKFMKERIKT